MSDEQDTPETTTADDSDTPGSAEAPKGREYPDYRYPQSWLFGLYLVALWVLIVFTFAGYWPRVEESRIPAADTTKVSAPAGRPPGSLESSPEVETVRRSVSDSVQIYFPGRPLKPFTIPLEKRLIVLALLAGMLGAWIHVAISFTNFLGSRSLRWSWGWWYVLRPFIGGAIALLVYFALRAGLVNGAGSAMNMSLHGIVAICGLVGWFSRKAAERLEEVMETALGESTRKLSDPINKHTPQPEDGKKKKEERARDKDTGEDPKPPEQGQAAPPPPAGTT